MFFQTILCLAEVMVFTFSFSFFKIDFVPSLHTHTKICMAFRNQQNLICQQNKINLLNSTSEIHQNTKFGSKVAETRDNNHTFGQWRPKPIHFIELWPNTNWKWPFFTCLKQAKARSSRTIGAIGQLNVFSEIGGLHDKKLYIKSFLLLLLRFIFYTTSYFSTQKNTRFGPL